MVNRCFIFLGVIIFKLVYLHIFGLLPRCFHFAPPDSRICPYMSILDEFWYEVNTRLEGLPECPRELP